MHSKTRNNVKQARGGFWCQLSKSHSPVPQDPKPLHSRRSLGRALRPSKTRKKQRRRLRRLSRVNKRMAFQFWERSDPGLLDHNENLYNPVYRPLELLGIGKRKISFLGTSLCSSSVVDGCASGSHLLSTQTAPSEVFHLLMIMLYLESYVVVRHGQLWRERNTDMSVVWANLLYTAVE